MPSLSAIEITDDLLEMMWAEGQGGERWDDYIGAFSSDHANKLYVEAGITTDIRNCAAFFAMISEETGCGRLVRESGKYSAKRLAEVFKARYRGPDLNKNGIPDKADHAAAMGERYIMNENYGHRLGNEKNGLKDDDGWFYRGGGPFQHTGIDAWFWLQQQTGLPFASDPETINIAELWPKIAVVTWTKYCGDLGVYARQGNFVACCKAINCGSPFSGKTVVNMAKRQAHYDRWLRTLERLNGEVASLRQPSRPSRLTFGMPKNPDVKRAQARLRELNYWPGPTDDGSFGAGTRTAVRAFQDQNGLPNTGELAELDLARLYAVEAVPYPPPGAVTDGRKAVEASNLPEAKEARTEKLLAGVTGGGVLLDVAGKAAQKAPGTVEALVSYAGKATQLRGALEGLMGFLTFASTAALPMAGLAVAVFLFLRYQNRISTIFTRWTRPAVIEEAAA